MEFIGDSIFPTIDKEIIAKMVEFSNKVGFSSLHWFMTLTVCWRDFICWVRGWLLCITSGGVYFNLSLPLTACPGGVCGAAVGSERKPLGVQPARHVPLVSADAGWPVTRIFQPGPACSLGVRWEDESGGWQSSGTWSDQLCLYLTIHKVLSVYEYVKSKV